MVLSATIVSSVEEFIHLKGKSLGCSGWLFITQDIVNLFAEATYDHQWIHTDTRRAREESPYGSTIAHGYLTLSLIPFFLGQLIKVENETQLINYSVDKMVFKSPVPVETPLRLYAAVGSVKDLGEMALVTYLCRFEIEQEDTVIEVAEGAIKYLYYFTKKR